MIQNLKMPLHIAYPIAQMMLAIPETESTKILHLLLDSSPRVVIVYGFPLRRAN